MAKLLLLGKSSPTITSVSCGAQGQAGTKKKILEAVRIID
jgi:hypothetical protein